MRSRPVAAAFDVIETSMPPEPVRGRLTEIARSNGGQRLVTAERGAVRPGPFAAAAGLSRGGRRREARRSRPRGARKVRGIRPAKARNLS